jgi:uncharacterized membrane-anchored protein YjiN (DUF445 family)
MCAGVRQDAGWKEARLKRAKWLATGLLGGMLALLAGSAAFQAGHPWLQWVRAFAEAGAVGAMADWYAVVALFRHPFGLPIPHTAIVRRNKDRIGESLGDFVEHNFLTPENVLKKLETRNMPAAVAEWLSDRKNAVGVAETAGDAFLRSAQMARGRGFQAPVRGHDREANEASGRLAHRG